MENAEFDVLQLGMMTDLCRNRNFTHPCFRLFI